MSAVDFRDIVAAICEIRPDLTDDVVTPEAKVTDDLALDSLDMIQLARLLRKRHRVLLDFENWAYRREGLGDIVNHLTPLDA